MFRAKSSLLFLAVLTAFSYAAGTVYFPEYCSRTCASNDFIGLLPRVSAAESSNRPYFWTSVALIHIRENFKNLSPPGIGRISGIVTSCVYEAVATTKKELKSSLSAPYSFDIGDNEEALKAIVDGAGFWAIRAIFGGRASFSRVHSLYRRYGSVDLRKLVDEMNSSRGDHRRPSIKSSGSYGKGDLRAAVFGAKVCQQVVDQFTADGFAADGNLGYRGDPTNFRSINKPQRLAGITDCDNEIVDVSIWQPLCIPSSSRDFGTTRCTPQEFLAPFAGRYTAFALEDGDENSGGIHGPPPPELGSAQYEAEWKEILEISGRMDDVGKIIAEYWADGPDSTAPAGHWLKIAADAALYERLDQAETAKLLFIVGNALNDAGVASWRTKFTFAYARPLQMIQCGEYRGQIRDAWRGPYLGVGPSNVSEWRPYQASDFVTPAFPAYVSGHSTFSAAGAEALKLYFGDDKYRGPSCYRVEEGKSLFEPRSNEKPGFSDVPNTGPFSIGYVPSEDVVLCWDTYTDAADQGGSSRFYGGIHVRSDDVVGQKIGRDAGRAVFFKVQGLKDSPSKVPYEKESPSEDPYKEDSPSDDYFKGPSFGDSHEEESPSGDPYFKGAFSDDSYFKDSPSDGFYGDGTSSDDTDHTGSFSGDFFSGGSSSSNPFHFD